MPAILDWGASNIPEYNEEEYIASLHRAFVVGKADSITLDSNPRNQRFLAACAAWAVQKEFLYVAKVESDGQSEVIALRLTAAGRAAIVGETK